MIWAGVKIPATQPHVQFRTVGRFSFKSVTKLKKYIVPKFSIEEFNGHVRRSHILEVHNSCKIVKGIKIEVLKTTKITNDNKI